MILYQANLVLDNMNPCIKKMEYAVRGPLVIRATAIEKVGFKFLHLREGADAVVFGTCLY